MSDMLIRSLAAVVERFQLAVASDAQLRADLGALAQAVLQLVESSAPAAPIDAPREPALGAAPKLADAESESSAQASEAIAAAPPSALGGVSPPTIYSTATSAHDSFVARPEINDEELRLIAKRCALKARGARWALKREHLLRENSVDFGSDIEPQDREIIESTRALPDCFLWMCHKDGPPATDPPLWENVAGCYEAAGAASDLLRSLLDKDEDESEYFEQALDLAAEAQSALCVVLREVDGRTDDDQRKLHRWLRSAAHKRQVHIQRYMRLNDAADAAAWNDLSERIGALESAFEQAREYDRRVHNLMGKVRYHTQLIAQNPDEDRLHDWKTVISAVDNLISTGVAPSDRHLRELLLPVEENLLGELELPSNAAAVFREIDRFLATRPESESVTPPGTESPDVTLARELLRGRTIVMIGGDRRIHAKAALKSELELRELIWVETEPHSSLDKFRPYVERPDVDLVLLAIRWSSHSYGEVRTLCDTLGKPLVRLPAGYSVNQVSHQIVTQRSEQLKQLDAPGPIPAATG